MTHQCPHFLACPQPERRHGLTRAPTRLDDDQWLPTDGNIPQLESTAARSCEQPLPGYRQIGVPFAASVTHCNEYPIYVFPEKGAALLPFPHSCVCERFIYSQDRSTYFPAAEWADRSWEYINRSQTHECRNWDWGRAILFLGIFVLNFRYCAFAVQYRVAPPPLPLSPAAKLVKTPIRVVPLAFVFSFGVVTWHSYANYFSYIQYVQYCYSLVPNLFHVKPS